MMHAVLRRRSVTRPQTPLTTTIRDTIHDTAIGEIMPDLIIGMTDVYVLTAGVTAKKL